MMMRANLKTMAVICDSSFISNRDVVTAMSKQSCQRKLCGLGYAFYTQVH